MFKLALETLTIKLSQYVVELQPVAINHDHVTGITLFRFLWRKSKEPATRSVLIERYRSDKQIRRSKFWSFRGAPAPVGIRGTPSTTHSKLTTSCKNVLLPFFIWYYSWSSGRSLFHFTNREFSLFARK
jgi:hypothetical protein